MSKKKRTLEEFRKDFHKTWAKLVAKAWSDDLFRQRLISNPRKVLLEAGLDFPSEFNFVVHEDTKTMIHLVIHEKPSEKLSEEELEKIAGGQAETTMHSCAKCYFCHDNT